DYFTGYLDLDIINLNNQNDLKLRPDLSLYSVDSTRDKLFYELKYDSEKNSKRSIIQDQYFLDYSKIIKDKSRQKEFLYLSYDAFELEYGEIDYEINNPIFASYSDKLGGIKTGYKKDDLKLDFTYSENRYYTVRDIVINPDLTLIFLKHSNIKENSENIQIKVLDENNNLLEIVRLAKYNDYRIDYKEGKVIFDPLIFFANNPDKSYKLTIDYKINKNITNDVILSKAEKSFSKNSNLKVYKVIEEEKMNLTGLVFEYGPDSMGDIQFEYQNLKQKSGITHISLNNGESYLKSNLYDKKEKSFGFKYNKVFKQGLLVNGYSIKREVANSLTEKIKEDEHHLFLNKKFNDKYSAGLEYMHTENSLGNKEYTYSTNLKSMINERLSLRTGYNFSHNNLNSKKKISLTNNLELEYSENLVISWGILQNLVNNNDYYQNSLKYNWNENIFSYQNKVVDLEKRLTSYNYQSKKVKLYQDNYFGLEGNEKKKVLSGIEYKFNKLSSIEYQNNKYLNNDIDTEKVYKYDLKLNNDFEISLNYLDYVKDINNQDKEKRKAKRSALNYAKGDQKISIQFENVNNEDNTYFKDRSQFIYTKYFYPSIYFSFCIDNYLSKEILKNIKKESTEQEFIFKYRPKNSPITIYFNQINKNEISFDGFNQKKNLLKNKVKLNYLITDNITVSSNFNKLSEELKTSDNLITNNIQLNRYSLNFKLKKYWKFVFEYRTLIDKLNNINDSGYLLALNRKINDNLALGLRYNFTKFNDDITNLTDNNRGLSLNLNYKW
ncbi:MAG: hypothetical protein ACQEQH_08475, partial [Bacillota bacterium]